MYYFGKVVGEYEGHVLHDQNLRKVYSSDVPSDFPCREGCLDGGFLPPRSLQTEGLSALVYLNGWTILSFWDRSGDKRVNSSSAFLLRGTFSFEEVLNRAKANFPSLYARFGFRFTLTSVPLFL